MLSAGLRAGLPEAARSRHEERASVLVGFLREAREAAVNWTSLEIHPKKVLKWNNHSVYKAREVQGGHLFGEKVVTWIVSMWAS